MQNIFREIKIQSALFITSPVKVSHSEIILRPTYPYQLQIDKATCCAAILFPTVFARSFKAVTD